MMDVLDEQFWLADNALDDWEVEWRIDYVATTSIDGLWVAVPSRTITLGMFDSDPKRHCSVPTMGQRHPRK